MVKLGKDVLSKRRKTPKPKRPRRLEGKTQLTEKTFELWDILENYDNAHIKSNIEYIMRREKVWKPGMSIVFPAGAFSIKPTKESMSYQQDFEVFKNQNRIAYHGTAYGSVSAGEILDMTIELRKIKGGKCK